MSRVLPNDPEDRGSIDGRVIPKTKKILDAALINTQHDKVSIKIKMEQSKEGFTPSPTQLKRSLGSPSTNLYIYIYIYIYIYVYIYIYKCACVRVS